ncbi:hypothetical protein K227x_56570 [Rubripirellula lacrimiformis]|uniref:DUF488 domain-containing protein n=1 Tax=Rubripirellula lacrimiformis TaxID=1930273 RepID=A0A517NJC1_9BACT|nr:DUF488 domain-containing protein [Rubripirellula lacrimiformis]QDT07231.1 hypothetical protein K227x_56570 [Rubripirellula lacrimiformis]
MLNRQRVLLDFLQAAGRPVLRTELTSWSFLLRNEYSSAGGSAFYDFVPYPHGPFSFTLDQEIGKLVDQSYVHAASDQSWSLGDGMTYKSPDSGVQRDITRIVSRFVDWPADRLLNYVCKEFPAYAVSSRCEGNAERPKTDMAVFTAGYEGESVDAFLNKLVTAGIRCLIDVRKNPTARRYGFHRSTLTRLTGNLGMDYVHMPELGIPSNLRQNLDTMADRESLFDNYERTTLADNDVALDQVADRVRAKPSVLVCMEAEAICCHRSRIAQHIADRTSLQVVNL